mgnify:FL=1
METVILRSLQHRQQECIAIVFEKNPVIQLLIQKQAGARWSKTCGCWYTPLSKSNYESLAKVLKDKAHLETDELKSY